MPDIHHIVITFAAVCSICFLCSSSCASVEAKKAAQEMPELTPEQVSSMTADEVAEYYAKRARLRAEKRGEIETKDTASDLISGFHSVEKRERMGDVNKPNLGDADSVFPWQSGSGSRRSESLLGRQSAIYSW